MTAADTQVGDADVSGISEVGVTTPLWTGDTGPFWVDVHMNVRVWIGKPVGDVLWWGPESGRTDLGISEETESLRGKLCLRGKSCRRGKLECTEELAGAERVFCGGEIASAMAIASVGLGFRRLLL